MDVNYKLLVDKCIVIVTEWRPREPSEFAERISTLLLFACGLIMLLLLVMAGRLWFSGQRGSNEEPKIVQQKVTMNVKKMRVPPGILRRAGRKWRTPRR
jgi:hypothetical protein